MFGWTDVNVELLESVIEDAAAIVISLPPKDVALSDDDLNRWLAVETMLSNSTVVALCISLKTPTREARWSTG